jgi:hypothetical protein
LPFYVTNATSAKLIDSIGINNDASARNPYVCTILTSTEEHLDWPLANVGNKSIDRRGWRGIICERDS